MTLINVSKFKKYSLAFIMGSIFVMIIVVDVVVVFYIIVSLIFL